MSNTPQQHRIGAILFVLTAVACCLALGWWQWERFESSSGTGQNLGYALQWPLFAVAFIFIYRRFIQLEAAAKSQEQQKMQKSQDTEEQQEQRVQIQASDSKKIRQRSAPLREIPSEWLPERPTVIEDQPLTEEEKLVDQQRIEYNRLLAQLAEQDKDQ